MPKCNLRVDVGWGRKGKIGKKFARPKAPKKQREKTEDPSSGEFDSGDCVKF